jgi:hypothetical protein
VGEELPRRLTVALFGCLTELPLMFQIPAQRPLGASSRPTVDARSARARPSGAWIIGHGRGPCHPLTEEPPLIGFLMR